MDESVELRTASIGLIYTEEVRNLPNDRKTNDLGGPKWASLERR